MDRALAAKIITMDEIQKRAKVIQENTGLPFTASLAQAKKEHDLNTRCKGPKKKYALVWEGHQQVVHNK